MTRIVLGITGLFASGKNTASNYFRLKGFDEIDVDLVGHVILERKKEELKNAFGDSIINSNRIDRKVLGRIVFNDTNRMELLNKITHPEIYKEVKHYIDNSNSNFIINAALLYKIGLDSLCDKVIFIKSDERAIIERAVKRDKLNVNEIKNRLLSQEFINRSKKNADAIIENMSTKEEFILALNMFSKTFINGVYNGTSKRQEGNVYP